MPDFMVTMRVTTLVDVPVTADSFDEAQQRASEKYTFSSLLKRAHASLDILDFNVQVGAVTLRGGIDIYGQ